MRHNHDLYLISGAPETELVQSTNYRSSVVSKKTKQKKNGKLYRTDLPALDRLIRKPIWLFRMDLQIPNPALRVFFFYFRSSEKALIHHNRKSSSVDGALSRTYTVRGRWFGLRAALVLFFLLI